MSTRPVRARSASATMATGQAASNSSTSQPANCRIITTYTYSTAVSWAATPQLTPVHTITLADPLDQAQATPLADPRLQAMQEARTLDPDHQPGDAEPQPTPAVRYGSDNPYPWLDVIAFEHVTSVGNCPKPSSIGSAGQPSRATSLTVSPEPSSVNVHLAILAGGVTVGVIVLGLIVAGGCIICLRRRRRRGRRRMSEGGRRLSETDETMTCQSSQTVGSVQTTLTERRAKCQMGWQMQEVGRVATYPPSSPIETQSSPTSPDALETLIRPGSMSANPFRDRPRLYLHQSHLQGSTRPGSLSDACSTEAPSYLPGDDARFMNTHQAFHASTTELTEASCAATIDSRSTSIRMNPFGSSSSGTQFTSPTATDGSSTLTPNLDSLINHKAFLLSMMINQHLLNPNQSQPYDDSILQPNRLNHLYSHHSTKRRNSLTSLNESIRSGSTHESTYWVNRHK